MIRVLALFSRRENIASCQFFVADTDTISDSARFLTIFLSTLLVLEGAAKLALAIYITWSAKSQTLIAPFLQSDAYTSIFSRCVSVSGR